MFEALFFGREVVISETDVFYKAETLYTAKLLLKDLQ